MSSSAEAHQLDPMLLERIELAFPALVGGFEVLERELTFDGRRIADFMAYSQERLFLVSVVDGGADESVLKALDALAFARTQREILATAVPSDSDFDGEVCVALVSLNGFGARQLERLSLLQGEGLWLLRKRELRTKRGTHTHLEPIDVGDGRLATRDVLDLPAWAIEEPHRSFLAQVAPDRLQLAIELVDRLRLVDSTTRWGLEKGELLGRFEQIELCRVSWVDGHLEAAFGPDGLTLAIRDRRAIDEAVDGVMAEYLGQLRGGACGLETLVPPPLDGANELPESQFERGTAPRATATEPPAKPAPFAAEAPSSPSEELRDLDELPELPDLDEEPLDDEDMPEDEELGQVDLRPQAPGPLLTPEEIRAFQE